MFFTIYNLIVKNFFKKEIKQNLNSLAERGELHQVIVK